MTTLWFVAGEASGDARAAEVMSVLLTLAPKLRFLGAGGPKMRALATEPFDDWIAEAGVLGVLPGLIGVIEALETIKLILGKGDSLVGRLLCFNTLTMEINTLKLRRDPNCPMCGDHPTIHQLIDYEEFCSLRH